MHAAAAIRRDAFRRTRRVAAGVGIVGLLTFVAADPGTAAPNAPAQASFNNGRGSASANGIKVNPVVGGLSFGVTTGVSIAGHQNTGAQGQSQAIDLGVIGVTLGAEGCNGADPTWAEEDQPQPVVVFSGEPGAEEGREESEQEIATKYARATAAPYGEAITTVLPAGSPDAVLVQGARAFASSGVVDRDQREARAISEVGRLQILGGLVEVRGMRWEAIHRSGAADEMIGTFTVDSLHIGGQAVPLPVNDAGALATAINDALIEYGITFTMPEVREEQGIVFVDPLVVGIVQSETRDDLLNDLIGQGSALGGLVQDLREQVFEVVSDLDCGELAELLDRSFPTKTVISVIDIALNSTLGGGSNTIELGGVQATTTEIVGFEFPGAPAIPDLTELPPAPPADPGPAPGSTAGDGTSGGSAASAPPPPTDPPPPAEPTEQAAPPVQQSPIQPIVSVGGERGGWLALVGAAGLGLLLACAEGDRRKMRRAMRAIQAPVAS